MVHISESSIEYGAHALVELCDSIIWEKTWFPSHERNLFWATILCKYYDALFNINSSELAQDENIS